MSIDVLYLVGGACLIIALILPTLVSRLAMSSPIVLVILGLGIGLSPFVGELTISPTEQRAAVEHVTELTVLVALMGVGLALDRPLSLRSWRSWTRWHTTWRLLAIGMPLSIAATALLGAWALGLGAATSLLLGAALAPTDPVLAADVQVAGPTAEELDDIGERDEVRFALTSEAGFNDALAFPFVYAAIYLAQQRSATDFLAHWLAWELVGKVLLGAAVGVASGWVVAVLAFHERIAVRLADRGEPLLAVGATLLSYGMAELVGGWGFLAVFACGLTLRSSERAHHYHGQMHELVEQFELLLTLLVLLLLGIACADGLLGPLDLNGVLLAVAVVFVVRPLTAWLALWGSGRRAHRLGHVGLGPREQLVTAFFGVRGIGSIYYIAYATGAAAFADVDGIWATVGFTILLSVVVHGVLATPAMRWVESRRAEQRSDTV